MGIDIRATVTCSLGTLISASISDDYVQGTGLIKTRGSCEISGTITPAIGTVVTFSYTKGGVVRSIPRKLRVLSSFADPFRRTTKVELGCKLTYLSDLQEPVDWSAFDDPGNAGYTEADAEIITIPISASSVMSKCLTELGITASSNPLTNKFSIERFDLSGGYVNVLSDLLVSESYCGYLNTSEVLQVFSLDQDGGTGPVIDATKIIDLGSIGVGQLPGEAVTVSYSSLKLKQPDNANGGPGSGALWETNESSNQRDVVITYTDINGSQQYRTYTVLDTSTSTTTYQDFTIKKLLPGTGSIKIISGYEKVRKVASRRTIEQTGSVSIEGSLAASYLANGVGYYSNTVTKDTTETFQYDEYGNETLYTSITLGSTAHLAGGLGVQDWVIEGSVVSPSRITNRMIAKVERFTETIDDYQRVVTKTYGSWSETIAGQQALASGLRDIPSAAALTNALTVLFPQALYLLSTTVETRRSTEGEIAPSGADVTNSAGADGGDPNNGYRTDSTADLELALGSATAQRRIEFSMPYAPDDTFYKIGANYYARASDAPEKARRYGRSQNRLLLGNRSGMNLQVAPEVLPSAPFDPIVVQANGLSALYRVNGTSWTMSSEGVVVATDALFWGAVGGTGTFWFPVAPGITTLPSTPAVVDGEMTVGSVVPVWGETAVLEARVRSTLSVTTLPYALELLTEVAPLTVRSKLVAARVLKVEAPASGITTAAVAPVVSLGAAVKPSSVAVAVAAVAPAVSAGASIKPGAVDLALAVAAPAVSTGTSVAVPALGIGIEAQVPTSVGPPPLLVDVPAANVTVAGVAPAVVTGASVAVPAKDIALAALVPGQVGPDTDPSFSSVQLLLHMNGTNGSTTFTDSSSAALTCTANGNAQISTAQSKFGGASGLFDGSGDSVRISSPPSALINWWTGNFTIEYWIRATSFTQAGGGNASVVAGNMSATTTSNYWSFGPISNGTVRLYYFNGSVQSITTTTALSTNTWHHLAFVKNGTGLTIYIDGVSSATGTVAGTPQSSTTTDFCIGQHNNTSFNGYLDEMRVTTAARYTSAFTPPAAPFPNA